MLFKDYHIPMIRSGSKTVTRREWDENYSRPNVGSVQIASDEMFTSDEEADCYIRILDVYDQPLGEMTDEDAQKEGDYEDMDDFREGYAKVYGEDAWDPEKIVAVVEFEYVGRERPETDAEQKQLVTDGGEEVGRAIKQPERSPFDATALTAEQYRELLTDSEKLVLRVTDGETRHNTFRFWEEDGQLYWRALSWTAPKQATMTDLSAALGGDHITQLLTEENDDGE
jgi:uncharacterized protein YhfF